MKHEKHVTDDLLAYAEGRLDGAARLTVEAHLHRCAACRAEYDELASLVSGLQAMPRALGQLHGRPATRWHMIEARLSPQPVYAPEPAWLVQADGTLAMGPGALLNWRPLALALLVALLMALSFAWQVNGNELPAPVGLAPPAVVESVMGAVAATPSVTTSALETDPAEPLQLLTVDGDALTQPMRATEDRGVAQGPAPAPLATLTPDGH